MARARIAAKAGVARTVDAGAALASVHDGLAVGASEMLSTFADERRNAVEDTRRRTRTRRRAAHVWHRRVAHDSGKQGGTSTGERRVGHGLTCRSVCTRRRVTHASYAPQRHQKQRQCGGYDTSHDTATKKRRSKNSYYFWSELGERRKSQELNINNYSMGVSVGLWASFGTFLSGSLRRKYCAALCFVCSFVLTLSTAPDSLFIFLFYSLLSFQQWSLRISLVTLDRLLEA